MGIKLGNTCLCFKTEEEYIIIFAGTSEVFTLDQSELGAIVIDKFDLS
jgi:hypothetical protein